MIKKKECPSCAMEVDGTSKVCPICGYEFGGYSPTVKWVAIVLLVITAIFLLMQLF